MRPLLFLTLAFSLWAAPPRFPFDPVALVEGASLAGDSALVAEYQGYTYAFATPAHRARFLAEPDRYAIQLAGACARMGALSGKGRVDLHGVHEGRLYLFASEACRATFFKDPARVLETPDPAPAADPEAEARGRALLARAIEGHGGAEALRRLSRLRFERRFEQGSGGRTYARTVVSELQWPSGLVVEDGWDDLVYRHADGPSGAAYEHGATREALTPFQRDVLLRAHRWREPLALLKAAQAGEAAVQALPGAAPGLLIHGAGATTRLWLDPQSGRVQAAEHRGWSKGFLGPVRREFGGYQAVGGLQVPTEVRVGEAVQAYTRVAVDGAAWFSTPSAPPARP